MSFQLSPDLDSNKIFLVQRSELEGRLDPSYYSIMPKMHNLVNLKKIANVKGGKRIPKDESFSFTPTKFKYLRVEDIAKNEISIDLLKNISQKLFNFLIRYETKENDLLISIAGTVGKIALLKNNTANRIILTENAAKIVLISSVLTIKALKIILQTNLIQKQIKASYIQTTIPKLGLDKILSLKIPIPPKAIQAQIVAKMDAAYAAKKQKETEAQRLLDSIDNYLLGALGIELPEQEANTLQSRIFTRQLSEISGRRFDPDYFQEYYRTTQRSLQNGRFECKTIKNMTDLVINGNTPASNDYSDVETEYPIIKVRSYQGEFVSLMKLDFTKAKKIKQAKQNDIFILSAAHQASYVGRFIKFLDSEPIENTSFVGELICIRANKSICDPMYLFSLLNIEAYKVLLNREKTGQTSHIYPIDIKHIKIPLPPLYKQTEIANHITKIRNQAKQLQQQAKAGLEQAKNQVEAIILGEDEKMA